MIYCNGLVCDVKLCGSTLHGSTIEIPSHLDEISHCDEIVSTVSASKSTIQE